MSIPHRKLREAIVWYELDQDPADPDSGFGRIMAAARKWADLTSEETVEKAAHVIYRFRWSDHSPEENEAVFGESREIAEAVLRAVQEPPQ
jgi:hypothetical protein